MTRSIAAILLIVLPLAFNVEFAALARRFDYPDILRRPTAEILERFRAGGSSLVLLWWIFAMTAVLLAPTAIVVSASLEGASSALLVAALVVGVMAAAVQFLGLLRWPFLVPFLARADADADADASPERRAAVDLVFQAFHRYLGVAVGEHLGYLFTGAWTVLVGLAIVQSGTVAVWLGICGVLIGTVLALCSLEFVGGFEEKGWALAGRVTPFAYIAWSIWLVAVGVALVLPH